MNKYALLFVLCFVSEVTFAQTKPSLSEANSTIQTFFDTYVSAAGLINDNAEITYTIACSVKDGDGYEDSRCGDYYDYYSVFVDGVQLHPDDLFHYDSYEVKTAGCNIIFKAKGLWGCSHRGNVIQDNKLLLKRIPYKLIRNVKVVRNASHFTHGCHGMHQFPTLEIGYIGDNNQIITIDIPLNEKADAIAGPVLAEAFKILANEYCND